MAAEEKRLLLAAQPVELLVLRGERHLPKKERAMTTDRPTDDDDDDDEDDDDEDDDDDSSSRAAARAAGRLRHALRARNPRVTPQR